MAALVRVLTLSLGHFEEVEHNLPHPLSGFEQLSNMGDSSWSHGVPSCLSFDHLI